MLVEVADDLPAAVGAYGFHAYRDGGLELAELLVGPGAKSTTRPCSSSARCSASVIAEPQRFFIVVPGVNLVPPESR